GLVQRDHPRQLLDRQIALQPTPGADPLADRGDARHREAVPGGPAQLFRLPPRRRPAAAWASTRQPAVPPRGAIMPLEEDDPALRGALKAPANDRAALFGVKAVAGVGAEDVVRREVRPVGVAVTAPNAAGQPLPERTVVRNHVTPVRITACLR